MFNADFYPTPRHVIDTMLSADDLTGKTVLEPSAGKGNIVDALNELGCKVISCEKDPDLAKIVESKSRFLKHDFLEVRKDEVSHIHAIVMNPPFSADEKHILHAWEIAPDGCTVIALCNWETLANRYTRSRQILSQVVNDYGGKENLGPVFDTAERKTGINIGLIRLYKPSAAGDFAEYFDSEEDDPEFESNGIMQYSAIREVVQRYVSAVRLYDQVIDNAVKMNDLVGLFGVGKLAFTCNEGDKETAKLDFVKGVQKQAWNWIFQKLDMQKYMTASLREDINKFVEQQEKVPFTMKNIRKMILMVVGTHGQRMDKVLLEVFDKLTKHYHQNRYAVEGWKTNSHYLVGKKFILEGVFQNDRWMSDTHASVAYGWRSVDLLNDLHKALCYITATPYDNSSNIYNAYSGREKEWGKWYDWGFFEVKAFKKGTAHCKFKDENVWALFNQHVARIKGFPLPENVKGRAAA